MPNDLTAKRNLLNSRDDVRSESQRQKLTSSSFTASIWTISGVVLVACGNIEDFLGIDDGGGGGGRSVHVQSSAVQGARIYFDADDDGTVSPEERAAQDAQYPQGFVTNENGEANGIPGDLYGKAFVAVLDGAFDADTGETFPENSQYHSIPDENGDHTLASPITDYVANQLAAGLTPEEVIEATADEVAELLGLDPATTLTDEQIQMRDAELRAILSFANYQGGGDVRIEALATYLAEEDNPTPTGASEFLVGDTAANPSNTLFIANADADSDPASIDLEGVGISTDAPTGTDIATIHAVSHGDESVEYSIVASAGSDAFTVNERGVISVADSTRLSASTVTLTVMVTNGAETQMVEVEVTIADAPSLDQLPASSPSGTVMENAMGATTTGTDLITGIRTGATNPDWVIRAPGGFSDKFDVVADTANPDTHKLVLKSGEMLDREAFPPNGEISLQVWAVNSGVRSEPLTLTITVEDANDAPVFLEPTTLPNGETDVTTGTETLSESAGRGAEVAQVRAHDHDTNPDWNDVTYDITTGNTDDIFEIVEINGEGVIRVADASMLDYESGTTSYTLTITATDGVDDSGTADTTADDTIMVTINVMDINDIVPMVTPPSQGGTFRVRTTDGLADAEIAQKSAASTGYSITITDADTVNDFTFGVSDPRFEFVETSAGSGVWDLTLMAGEAVPEQESQTATPNTITLTYYVDDGANRVPGDTVTLEVVATPVEFTSPAAGARTIDLAEDTTADSTVHFTVQAMSSDDDGSVDIDTYMFLDDSDTATTTYRGFEIDSSSGEITLTGSLNHEDTHEDGSTINLRVEATDMNTPPETNILRLTVNVGDVNDNDPVFVAADANNGLDYAPTIPENTGVGSEVARVRADDADGTATHNTVTYSITAGNTGNIFDIDANGVITLLSALDYETATSHTLTITATDGTTPITETVTVTVGDANDDVPMVTPPTGGVFRVRTTDGLPAAEIAQNSAAGTGYRITIDDADTNNVFTFNVSDPRFEFQAQGSADVTWELMLLAGQAVPETEGGTITLTYHVNDGVANSVNVGQTTVTINVVDTPVEFATPDAADLMADENDADWTLTVTATSEDSNSDGTDSMIVSYEIVEVLDENDMVVASDGVFTIADRTIGEISISDGLDYETSASYTLVIQATDMAESAVPGDTADTNTARFTINVQDLNEHDPVIGPLQLAQGVMGGTSTLAGATTGDDTALTGTADAEYIYGDAGADTITGGGGADHIIGGAGTDGITLSSDANNVETIYYRFSSAGRFPAEIDGTDTINGFRRGEDRLVLIDTDSESTLDLNTLLSDAQNAALNPATFAVNPLFDVAITEATVNLIGMEIQFDEASIIIKYDSGSYVTVRSGGSWQTAGDDYLGVLSSGVPSELETSGGLLDNTLLPNYFGDTGNTNLQITGDDITANLGIDVLISESRTNADGVFATVSATDDDGTSEISYDITGGTGETLFALDANGGISMVSGATLDYESTTSYTLIISATDGLDTSDARDTSADDTTTITIQLTDVNDNPPMVTADAGTIRTTTGNGADTPTGYSITVTDADTVGTLMVDSDDERFRFDRDGTTDTWNLILLANQAVTAGTISLGYSATDGDNPPATGTITLMAVDTPVKFTAPAAADLIITENDSTNGWTVTITATSTGSDSDGSDSAISGYEILEVLDADGTTVDMNGVFSITDAGVISVSGALDHETSAYYTLRIEATDTVESGVSGDTADTGTTDLRVNVGDVNEADPVIEGSPTADAFVTTGATGGTEVTTVVVTDADTSQTFTYAITDGNTGDAFAIDANGVITVASGTTLDRATTATYDLVVTVTDNGVDASGAAATKSDTQNIKVTVREEPPTPIAEQVQGASVQSGTDAADVIDRGDQTGFEVIQGGDLSDTITVGSGGSVVFGGYGSDAITLGDGVDTVVHRFASVKGIWRNDDGADVIRDFELGKDKFILVDTDDNPIDLTTFLDETISGSHSILGPDDMQPIAERGAAGVLIRALPDLDADDLTYIGVAITISTPVKQDGPGGEDPNTAAIEIQIYWDESFVIDPNGTPDADNYERFLGIVDLVGFTGGQLNLENDFTDYSILPTYLNDDDTTRGFDVISLDDLGVEII